MFEDWVVLKEEEEEEVFKECCVEFLTILFIQTRRAAGINYERCPSAREFFETFIARVCDDRFKEEEIEEEENKEKYWKRLKLARNVCGGASTIRTIFVRKTLNYFYQFYSYFTSAS